MSRFALSLSAVVCCVVFGWQSQGLAFGVPGDVAEVGDPVAARDVNPLRYYGVYLPEEISVEREQCALISGSELVVDSDLRHYGTCFINDPGTFVIIELAESLSANYADTLRSSVVLRIDTILLEPVALLGE